MTCSGSCSSARSPPTCCQCKCNGAGHGTGAKAYTTTSGGRGGTRPTPNPATNTVQGSVREFIQGARPAEHTDEAVRQNKVGIRDALGDRMDLMDVRAIGSHARGTALRNSSDADYMAILRRNEARWGDRMKNSDTVLRAVRDALASKYPRAEVVKDGQAIRVQLGDESVDVVPAIYHGTAPRSGHPVYEIPDGHEGWMKTSPDAHSKYLRDADERAGGKLKEATRGIKKFRDRTTAGVPIKSLYIEMALADSGAAEGIKPYTHVVRDALANLRNRRLAPIPDPTETGDLIYAAPTEAKREAALAAVTRAAERATRSVEAEERGNTTEARRLWGLVFNDEV